MTGTITKDTYFTRHYTTLDSSYDLNDFIGRDHEGMYYISGDAPANAPGTYGHLLVLGVSTVITQQVFLNNSHMWMRGYGQNQWYAWKQII